MANIITDFWHQLTKQSNATKQPKRIPSVDKTESQQCNKELTYGVFHNQYENFKFAGSLSFLPIMIPVYFMGIPIPKCENDITQKRLEELVEKFALEMQQIHLQCHRDGTVWVFPFYNPMKKQLQWEYFADNTVYNIIRNIDTNEIISVTTKESLTITTGQDTEISTIRTRIFTATKIIETYEGGSIPSGLHNTVKVNVAGILPICFSNNADLNEIRAHSDLERILTDLKDYHDIDLARSRLLSKFKPKMALDLKSSSLDDWLANNGYDDIGDVDLNTIDLIITTDESTVGFIFPENLSDFYKDALKDKFKKIVEGSGVPEIAWGLKSEGNLASVDEQMSTLLSFVTDKRLQKTDKYQQLFIASLKILSIAEMTAYDTDIEVTWDELSGTSKEVKSIIFSNFAKGVESLVSSAGFTKKQLLEMWKNFYPKETDETIEEFVEGISDMGKHNSWKNSSYVEVSDLMSENND